MTTLRTNWAATGAWRRAGRTALPVLGASFSSRAWRALAHLLVGLPLALAGAVAVPGTVLLWAAASYSLADGVGSGELPALLWGYAAFLVLGPFLLLGGVLAGGALQRARFRAILGVAIDAPLPPEGTWPRRQLRRWGQSATWRQLGYHLLAAVLVPTGVLLAAGCCWVAAVSTLPFPGGAGSDGGSLDLDPLSLLLALAALLAVPWLARGLARLDAAAGKALLGPGPGERLALRVASLTRSRAEVVAATDAERRRIERDLHDGAQQRLVSLAMNLGMARTRLTDLPGPAREAIEQAHEEATAALAELRDLVRGLYPAVLDDRGLDAALSGIVARAPLHVRLRVEVEPRCSSSVEAVAYFVVSEALTNVARHAGAGNAEVTAVRTGDRLLVTVTDDGRGGATLDPDGERGSGLRGLAQRVASVDGTLTVDSPAGGPTTITAELPCES